MRRLLPVSTALLLGCGGEVLYVDVGTAQLRVELQGPEDADTLILVLHGGPANDSSPLRLGRAAEELGARYRMAYLNQRGMGGSTGRMSEEELTVQQWADDVAVVVEVLERRERPDALWLLGHSWGGMLGTVALLDTPAAEVVDGWIEVAGCHDADAISEEVAAKVLEDAARAVADGDEDRDAWSEVAEAVRGLPPPPQDIPTFRALYAEAAKATQLTADAFEPVETLDALGHIVTAADEAYTVWLPSAVRAAYGLEPDQRARLTEARLSEITVPSLFVYARYDYICPTGLGERAAARIGSPRTRVVELPAAGHQLMFDDPEGYVDAITTFLAEGEAP